MSTKTLAVALASAALILGAATAVAQTSRGDPTTARADGLGNPWGLIADPFGDFIVSDREHGQVWWVTTDGRKQVIASALSRPAALAWDVFSNLLIVTDDGVYKLNPKGRVSQLFAAVGLSGVALAPDGTLWFTNNGAKALYRYDEFGNFLDYFELTLFGGQAGPFVIAISRFGDVYFTSNGAAGGTTVYRLANRQAVPLFSLAWRVLGMAIDVDGNLYLSGGEFGAPHVALYNASGTPLADPLATQLNAPTGIAFGRNQDGSMNARLFVVQYDGRFVELSSGAARQPGAPVAFATPAQAVADLLKPGALTEAQRFELDDVGNNNGRYDIGDLRAFLIHTTTLLPVWRTHTDAGR